MKTISDEQWASVCMLAVIGARAEREDVGGLMKFGAFHILEPDIEDPNGLVDLANAIEEGDKLFDVLRDAVLAKKRVSK